MFKRRKTVAHPVKPLLIVCTQSDSKVTLADIDRPICINNGAPALYCIVVNNRLTIKYYLRSSSILLQKPLHIKSKL